MAPANLFNHLFSSFRSRLFLIFTFFTIIISISFLFLYINVEIRNYHERALEKASLLASRLAVTIRIPLYSGDISELTRLSEELLSTTNIVRITVSGNEGNKLVDISSPDYRDSSSLINAKSTVTTAPVSPSAETAMTGVPAKVSTVLGEVAVVVDNSDLKSALKSAILGCAAIVLFFGVALLTACYPVLKRVTSSFDALTEGLNRMTDGDFSRKIVVVNDNEAGRAAHAVNKLSEALKEREEDNRRLQENLLNSMRLEVQEEKRLIMAKLIQTNRMTSLGLLISSMAHNINTPNGAIILAAQHLSRSWKDALPILEQATKEEGEFTLGGLPFRIAKAEILGANDSILNNAERVGRVIQDLRAYNLGEKGELTPGISINRIVTEAMTIIRAHGIQGGVAIVPSLAPSLPEIVGNQYQLEQVVVNLLLNAMQAMSNINGPVKVSTGHSNETNEVSITVSDQGEGIAPEVQKHLFEAFFSTRIDKGGSGLGLYISKFIVTEHRGRLVIESDKANGTNATVYLPAG